jgi:hypothetical protein
LHGGAPLQHSAPEQFVYRKGRQGSQRKSSHKEQQFSASFGFIPFLIPLRSLRPLRFMFWLNADC